ncbi:MAG: sigma-70 family RNA polymerase sigma factor [Pseudomonadota bacterium]
MPLQIVGASHMQSSSEETDLALLVATAQGDMSAFERLHRRFHPRLFGFALRLTDRHDLAEEVVNDTMMTVWRKAAAFQARSRASTWIFGIAYRIALKARHRRRGDRLHDEIDDEMPAERTGTQEVEALFDRKQVAAALRLLPTKQRATVELTYFYGYALAEIAEITDCPVGTVKTRMFHARARLREILSGDLAAGSLAGADKGTSGGTQGGEG